MPLSTLRSLIRYLEKDYYVPIELCCNQINDIIAEIHGGDDAQTASLYTALSKKLAGHVGAYLILQRQFLKPYENAEVSKSYRDEHSATIISLLEDHIQLLLMQLRSVVAPLPHHILHQDWDKALRQEVKKLNTLLVEMFQLQKTNLVTLIEKAEAVSNNNGTYEA